MSKADSVAAASAEADSANAALAAAQALTPADQSAVDAASARSLAANQALEAANALPADDPAPLSPSVADLNTMDVSKVDVASHAAAVVAATEIHNVALELNSAIDHNQPQAARGLRKLYDELVAKLEGK